MPRVLGEGNHSLVVHDPVSGTAVTLYYRRPTSEERVAYQMSAFRLEGGQRRFCLGETRLRFGLAILTGFGAGDFLVMEEGTEIPLDPEHHPDWQERLGEHAPDLVSYLAQQIFEGLRLAPREEPECPG
jgi:hypothetical protein